jgi:hypothetical protein
MTTFGFEAEFELNALEVAACLHARNGDLDVPGPIIGSAELHRYHCECDFCRVAPEYPGGFVYPFRAQTDSSCSGEIISKVFNTMDEAKPFMVMLQDAAVEADGTPGYNSGFHVHSLMPSDATELIRRSERFFQYLRWEPTLALISRGRFDILRSMNASVFSAMTYKFEEIAVALPSYSSRRIRVGQLPQMVFEYYDTITSTEVKREICRALYRDHRQHDRHSYLNVNTRWDTWEFRLFNSTRSAWRMELFCLIALAFANNGFVNLLAEPPASEILYPNIPLFTKILQDSGMGRAADLLTQQIEYQVGIDTGEIPFVFELAVL